MILTLKFLDTFLADRLCAETSLALPTLAVALAKNASGSLTKESELADIQELSGLGYSRQILLYWSVGINPPTCTLTTGPTEHELNWTNTSRTTPWDTVRYLCGVYDDILCWVQEIEEITLDHGTTTPSADGDTLHVTLDPEFNPIFTHSLVSLNPPA